MSREIHVFVPGHTENLRFSETVRLGRAETNDIVVRAAVVSGVHLELRRTGSDWDAIDLDSSNGTYMEGQAVTKVRVGSATTLSLGFGGPKVHLGVPVVESRDESKAKSVSDADRYFGEVEPEDMSANTRFIRVTLNERRVQETTTWRRRVRKYRIAVGALTALAGTTAGAAIWQTRRVEALRGSA